MNGLFERSPPIPTCNFAEPCPFLNGVTPDNYLVVPAGIQLGNLLLSAFGNGQIDANGNAGEGPGTYLRVTGALVLDCGHGITNACYDDDPQGDPGDISDHSNQEIHPIYSIDIINFPYRPEDINISGRTDLSGTYGGSDGSTYYLRQTGSTLTDPNIDFAKLAQGLGVYSEGPITNPKDLGPALTRAIAVVKRGEPALVDVVTQVR